MYTSLFDCLACVFRGPKTKSQRFCFWLVLCITRIMLTAVYYAK